MSSKVKNPGKIAARRAEKAEKQKEAAAERNVNEMADVITMLLEEEDKRQNEVYDKAFQMMTNAEVTDDNNLFVKRERTVQQDGEGDHSTDITDRDLVNNSIKSSPQVQTNAEVVNGSDDGPVDDSGKQPSEAMKQEVEQLKERVLMDIRSQVEQLQNSSDIRKVDPSKYVSDAALFNTYYSYVMGNVIIPQRHAMRLPLNEYINNTTIFKYNCFDSPNLSMGIQIPEKIIYMDKLNKIFGYDFIDTTQNDFHFADTDLQLVKFLFDNRHIQTTKLEYTLIKSMIGKLIINLNTDVELALRDERTVRLDSNFRQCISKDMQLMKHIQVGDGKTAKSWRVLTNAMLSLDGDTDIYVHNGMSQLNQKLLQAYDKDFLCESLIGSMLKCYLPSVAINYFYVLKGIYLVARFMSIYMMKNLFEGKTVEQICDDLSVIGNIAAIIYENLAFVYKMIPRTLPTFKHELSKETHMYITNHLLVGGQYYILKMFVECIPSLNIIMKKV